jgi:hypothetical protein
LPLSNAESWQNFRLVGAPDLPSADKQIEKPRISAISEVWHGSCNPFCIRRNGPTGIQGVTTMSFNISNMPQLAVSVFGALLAATLFVSAAVGPVGQFI